MCFVYFLFLGRMASFGDEISLLPNEILLNIFCYLQPRDFLNLYVSSRRFFSLIPDSALWKSVKWNHRNSGDNQYLVTLFKLCSPSVKKLIIEGHCTRMAVFCSLILKCYNLNVIRLDGISVTPLQMKRLVDNLPSLYNVSIDIRQLANFKRIKEYLQSGQNLQHLSISIPLTCRCSTSVIEEIWKNQGYRPLEVSLCSSLVWRTGSGVHHNIISAPEQAVFRVFLRKKAPLDLFDEAPVCEFPYRAHSNYQLSSQVVTCLGSKTLPVTAQCRRCQPTSSISSLPSSIKAMVFSKDVALLPSDLDVIADSCPSLERLVLKHQKDCLSPLTGLASVACKCSALKGLCLLGIHKSSFVNIVELWKILSGMRNLRHLALNSCLIKPNNRQMDGTVHVSKGKRVSHIALPDPNEVAEMSRYLSSMRQLIALQLNPYTKAEGGFQLVCCGGVTAHHFKMLSCLPALCHLSYLEIPITVCLEDIFQNLTRLNYAVLCSCTRLNVLPTSLTSCQSLEQISLSHIRSIPDGFFDSITDRGKLSHLSINTEYISSATVLKLAEVPSIQRCRIICGHVDKRVQLALKEKLKKRSIDFVYSDRKTMLEDIGELGLLYK